MNKSFDDSSGFDPSYVLPELNFIKPKSAKKIKASIKSFLKEPEAVQTIAIAVFTIFIAAGLITAPFLMQNARENQMDNTSNSHVE